MEEFPTPRYLRTFAYKIYALIDKYGSVFYIGRTRVLFKQRWLTHVCDAKKGRGCKQKGSKVLDAATMKLIQKKYCNSETAGKLERFWINYYKQQGHNLLNKSVNK